MPPVWKPKDPELLQSWIKAIDDEAWKDLNEVERGFINNVRIRLRAGWDLTKAQEDWLERIYAEKTK